MENHPKGGSNRNTALYSSSYFKKHKDCREGEEEEEEKTCIRK
jgi:hypothetical protein